MKVALQKKLCLYVVKTRKGEIVVDKDEFIKPGMTMKNLNKNRHSKKTAS